MSGQSAALSLKEAKAMQERICHSGSHSKTHGGEHKTSSGDSTHRKEK